MTTETEIHANDRAQRWLTLTSELKSLQQPIGVWFDLKLPNRKPIYEGFKSRATFPAIEPPPAVDPSVMGWAFEYYLRYVLVPHFVPRDAVIGAKFAGRLGSWDGVAEALVGRVQRESQARQSTGPSSDADEQLIRGCWALGIFESIGRGAPYASTPFGKFGFELPAVDDLMAAMPVEAVGDVARLLDACEGTLLPYLGSRGGTPLFGAKLGRQLIAADCDIVQGGAVVELKLLLNRRSGSRTPRCLLGARDLYQVVAYAALGLHEHNIDEVVMCNPRFRCLKSWPLDELLTTLAGRRVSAPAFADEFVSFLEDPLAANVPPEVRSMVLKRSADREALRARMRTLRVPNAASDIGTIRIERLLKLAQTRASGGQKHVEQKNSRRSGRNGAGT